MPLPADNLLGPYVRPSACGHHMIFLECFFQHVIWYGPKSEKLIDAHKAEILVKYTDCAELWKITIANCKLFIYLFFQMLQISLLFILFD